MGGLDKPPGAGPRRAADLATALALIAVGCVTNNLVLELIVSKKKNEWADPGAGGLLTFLQFVAIAAVTSPHALRWHGSGGARRGVGVGASGASSAGGACGAAPLSLRPTVVPLRHYAGMTALFFTMSYLNNWAFAFNISQPLHMVFRSSSLMVAYVMGATCFGKRYTRQQLGAVVLLTLGAAAATFAEAFMGDTAAEAARRRLAGGGCVGCGDGPGGGGGVVAAAATATAAAAAGGTPAADAGAAYMLRWAAGVAILCAVLVLQTLLSNYQNWAAAAFGKAPHEGMFWSHALSLPAFALTARDLAVHARVWSASPPVGGALAALAARLAPTGGAVAGVARVAAVAAAATGAGRLPLMWAYVAANVASQYACIAGVYRLTGLADPLTVNVALTVRKFASLMLSVAAFDNTFTAAHWAGAVLVFAGALLYAREPPRPPGGGAAAAAAVPGGRGNGAADASAAGASAPPRRDGGAAPRLPRAPRVPGKAA